MNTRKNRLSQWFSFGGNPSTTTPATEPDTASTDTESAAALDEPFDGGEPAADYHAFYGFEQSPFELESDPTLFVLSPRHEEALDKIHRGVTGRKAITVLTGKAGTGKTLLLQTIMGLADSPYVVAYVFNPTSDTATLLDHILGEFGITAFNLGKGEKLKLLYDFVLRCANERRRPLIVIDDAQKLSVETLDEIRMIANLANPTGKLLQFLLAGHDDFRKLLASPALRMFKERVGARFELKPLTINQTYRYINERCLMAGAQRVVFDKAVIIRIFSLTRGLPRLINTVCDALLLQAFLLGHRRVQPADVTKVGLDLDLRYAPIVPRPGRAAAARRRKKV